MDEHLDAAAGDAFEHGAADAGFEVAGVRARDTQRRGSVAYM
jgi:hypothetical protein